MEEFLAIYQNNGTGSTFSAKRCSRSMDLVCLGCFVEVERQN